LAHCLALIPNPEEQTEEFTEVVMRLHMGSLHKPNPPAIRRSERKPKMFIAPQMHCCIATDSAVLSYAVKTLCGKVKVQESLYRPITGG
jgi:hypothetical protein